LSVEVEIQCFWFITSQLTLPTSAYFCRGGSHINFPDLPVHYSD